MFHIFYTNFGVLVCVVVGWTEGLFVITINYWGIDKSKEKKENAAAKSLRQGLCWSFDGRLPRRTKKRNK